ncbi:HD domain-containing protein [Staphylococcus nepalensis]|uniref:HD domain-containing protein n=1 Tax=Staphylococcus nepalensis TaxID=214473 RepID=UPI001A9A0182|nr:HD domain-containing protein [Staphylococcus nepalensis]MBO1222665.1 HD domain-containing protein [Staphylococcus nepalensis]
MFEQDILNKANSYMETFHYDDVSGHDIAHVNRVTKLAEYIASNEQTGHLLTIQLASILHDTIDEKIAKPKEAKARLINFFAELNLSQTLQESILHIIENMSYKNGANNNTKLSIEGQIVRDADRLDAMGAIGIARTFQFAGHFGEPMWVENQDHNIMQETNQNYNDWPSSAIKHFFEKLLKLKTLMHTKTAKNLAQQRHDYMQDFVQTFFKEWYFKY